MNKSLRQVLVLTVALSGAVCAVMLFSANAQSNFHEIDVGPDHSSVEVTAEVENSCNVDIVLVYDRSGSMEYDTLCYGCWEPFSGTMYPSGVIYPLPWSSTTTATADHCADACEETDYITYTFDTDYQVNDCNYYHEGDDEYYIVIEAEEYSNISVVYQRDYYRLYKTYWVMQRNAENAAFEEYDQWDIEAVGAMGRDARGAYLSHHPYCDAEDFEGALGVACTLDALQAGEKCRYEWEGGRPDGTILEGPVPNGPFDAPRADYEFYAPRSGDYYFWIRGQAGMQQTKWGEERNNRIFWGVNGAYSEAEEENSFPLDAGYDGAIEDSWDWRCLGAKNLPQGDVTLNLWAGGAGFDVDRIVITTDNTGDRCASDSDPPGDIENFEPNNGRTDWACEPCDPRFAGRPGGQIIPYRPHCPRDQRFDDIYDDEQHIRNALEAAKHLIGMLDPGSDQIGYVSYSTEAVIENELQCLQDPSVSDCTTDVFTDTVIAALDTTRAGGGTNVADGIKAGIEALSTKASHYGRPDAGHVMILMTDGQANLYPNDKCWTWPSEPGTTDEEKAADCVLYYAHQAAEYAIVIHTITLGFGADQELMAAVADITGGTHSHAPGADALLESIFEELYLHLCLSLPPNSRKTASTEIAVPGQTITYAIAIQSPGLPPTTTTYLTDVVPPSLSYVPGTLTSTTGIVTDTDTPTLRWSGILSPTPAVTVTYAVTVSTATPQVITNMAVVAAPGFLPITRTATVTVQVASPPDLAPSYKVASTGYAGYGERITYTVAISNSTGPLSNTVLFTDTIPDGLSYVPRTLTATTGIATDTDAPTLRWSGVLSLTPAITITYAVTVSITESQVITNTAIIVAPGYQTITRTAAVTVQIARPPDLAPSYKVASTEHADYGEHITYTVAISNSTGPLSNVVLFTDTIPDGLSYVPGTLTATTGIVTDANVPTLQWSGILSPTPAITITYAVTASVTESQVITNTAIIVAPGYQTITRTATVTVQVVNWQNIYLPVVMRNFTDSWWPRSHVQEKRLLPK